MNVNIIPFQPPLPPVVPTIEGNVDYRIFRDQLLRIDQLLLEGGLENQFIQNDLQAWSNQNQNLSPRPNSPVNSIAAELCVAISPARCSMRTSAPLPCAWPTVCSCRISV